MCLLAFSTVLAVSAWIARLPLVEATLGTTASDARTAHRNAQALLKPCCLIACWHR